MKSFYNLLNCVTASPYHDQMIRFAAPLYDYLGVNHFWYYKISHCGHYSYLGTHTKWSEYCFANSLTSQFSCLRHPDTLQSGISLMKATEDAPYKEVLEAAWNKFEINFNIDIVEKVSDGVEAFGFATRFNDVKAEERLLNNLPLLRTFIKNFRSKHVRLFKLLDDNQVNLAEQFGSVFYKHSKGLSLPGKRDVLLRKMGFSDIFFLTARELDVLKFVLHGYPAGYIAENLQLCKKTVENYIATIKCKLACDSKVQLIEKAKELDAIGFFLNE